MSEHSPVLLQESIDGLNLRKEAVFVDATAGSGGHTLEVFRRYGDAMKIIVLDADPMRVASVRETFTAVHCEAEIFNENFRDVDKVLASAGIHSISAILFDLGLNSEQLESSGKGFSFQNEDEPLLMTFGSADIGVLTAREILNNYDEKEIADLIYQYGEEKYSRRLAKAIVEERRLHKFEIVGDLVALAKDVLPKNYERGRIHPATRTFQALRIAVNDEMGALIEGLEKSFSLLESGGRIAVISFHSLEDRIVKNFFRDRAHADEASLITKKPLRATAEECRNNPRSRSAKLRILEKI